MLSQPINREVNVSQGLEKNKLKNRKKTVPFTGLSINNVVEDIAVRNLQYKW